MAYQAFRDFNVAKMKDQGAIVNAAEMVLEVVLALCVECS